MWRPGCKRWTELRRARGRWAQLEEGRGIEGLEGSIRTGLQSLADPGLQTIPQARPGRALRPGSWLGLWQGQERAKIQRVLTLAMP